MITYLDTNIVLYLHAGDDSRISQKASKKIDNSDLLISAMTMLELEMLYEKRKTLAPAPQILSDLNQQLGATICQLPMSTIVSSALQVKWTRDPGDRLIVANAMANNDAPLITSDRLIRKHYKNAIW